MRRFLNSSDSSINCRPERFREEFSAMIKKSSYSKGSLAHFSLPMLLGQAETRQGTIEPLAPIYEDAFEPHIKEDVEKVVSNVGSHIIQENTFEVLSLFLKCKAIKVGKYVLGSKASRFSTSIVKVQTAEDSTSLAEVQYFAKCTVLIHDQSAIEMWIVAVSLFTLHNCKMWYGKPCEVWPAVPSLDIVFVPISSIICRVAYCKSSVNFGRIIGTDHVIIASPID